MSNGERLFYEALQKKQKDKIDSLFLEKGTTEEQLRMQEDLRWYLYQVYNINEEKND